MLSLLPVTTLGLADGTLEDANRYEKLRIKFLSRGN